MPELVRRRAEPLVGLLAQLLLLAGLTAAGGLGPVGWGAGVLCAMVLATALARGLGSGVRFGPASWLTLVRATLAVGVAALAADAVAGDAPVALLVALASVALALDLLDGPVARRTRTESALGARFDGEVDAFLIPPSASTRRRSTARGCSRSGSGAMPSSRASGCCRGCAGPCRRDAGAASSPRSRASC
jgi:hypothetical protein